MENSKPAVQPLSKEHTPLSGNGSHVSVIVIGAGPYELGVATHLTAAGVDTRVSGKSMESWSLLIPKGMKLRSLWTASKIAEPNHKFGLSQFADAIGFERPTPVPAEQFCAYGRWFTKKAVPQLERVGASAAGKDTLF